MAAAMLRLSLPSALTVPSLGPSPSSSSSAAAAAAPERVQFSVSFGHVRTMACAVKSLSVGTHGFPCGRRIAVWGRVNGRSRRQIVRMAPEEEKMTRRSPLDFPIEWERPKPGRRPDIFPQFSPMKTPLPPPLPADPPEEDEEEEEKKEEEEEDPEREETDKPEKQ